MFVFRTSRQVIKSVLRTKWNAPLLRTFCNKEIEEALDQAEADRQYSELAETFIRPGETHNCLIIQPYVKWGPKKLSITPEEQLEEAVALIKTLPSWTVDSTLTVPLESLDKKSLFKSGNMEKISNILRRNTNITAVFINSSNLKRVTSHILHENFRLPILDRYKIVMQILKMHATSKHAKLQVALAELYFVHRKAEEGNMFHTQNREALKLMFQSRESKLKEEIEKLRAQRNLLRNKRQKMNYPIVAVVGYTNSGKTSIIKALTGEKEMQPRDQLFATLDVTVHSGVLPSRMEVLYVDTVGFLSDLPTNLIECFVATLEDAVLADLILHVEDLSASCFEYKREHVIKTLEDLGAQLGTEHIMDKVLSVGNKCDLVDQPEKFGLLPVSAKTEIGLDQLRSELENKILETTGRKKVTIKVKNGGEISRWLHKNATVLSEKPSEEDPECLNVNVIISNSNLSRLKHHFT